MSTSSLVFLAILASYIMASNMTLEGENEKILTSPDQRDLFPSSQNFSVPINKDGSFYSRSSSPKRLNEDWMSYILPTTLITNLSIPGTHDTCAKYGGDGV